MPLQASCQSDVFSLGVTIFFCATGRFPFCDAKASTLTICHRLTEDPTAAKTLQIKENGTDPEWHEALATIVARALQKQPKYRYTTATAMLDDIKMAHRYMLLSWTPRFYLFRPT